MNDSKVVIEMVFTSPDFKVIKASGKSGDALKRHMVNTSAVLLVKKGVVNYKQDDEKEQVIYEGEGRQIPANVYHEFICNDHSEVFVIIPKDAKMKFEK